MDQPSTVHLDPDRDGRSPVRWPFGTDIPLVSRGSLGGYRAESIPIPTMQLPPVASLAVPAVLLLISFLAYSSQWLFLYLEPCPLEKRQTIIFNSLLVCLLVSYARACRIDPGHIPKTGCGLNGAVAEAQQFADAAALGGKGRQRWCRRCEAVKPPRAHHCKVCKR